MNEKTIEQVLKFRDERNWKQFHNPKDLAISICLEAAELLEVFQWSADDVRCAEKTDKIREELADVVNYCILMADTCGLDLDEIVQEKIRKNAEKYPVEKAYGSKEKYTELKTEHRDRTDEKIRLKIVHTDGVVHYMTEICRRMNLPEEDCRLAELIALLHDIGRFEQLKRYDSFERDTMDHAAYGVQILFGEQQMIRRFVEEDTWDDIIREAIARHSDFSGYDPSLTSRQLLYVQLIRDADKLDNCRVKLEEPVEVLLGCTAEEVGRQDISPEVWEECLAHTSVHLEKRKTKMDYWVSYVAYFFDIAYKETMDIIREERYVERVIGRIPYENPETERKMRELCGMVEATL